MTRSTTLWRALVLAPWLLVAAGCSSSEDEASPGSDAETGEEADLVAAARAIPPAAAQAVTLRERIIAGLSVDNARKLHMVQLRAQDFRGQEAVYLNFTAPDAIKDPWGFALGLDPEAWAEETSDSPWTTTITGATTVHAPVSLSAVGLGLLVKLGKTAQAMGGGAQVEQILAATPTRFFLVKRDGSLWDAETAAVADPTTLAELKVEYTKTVKSLSRQSLVKDMKQKWAPAMGDQASGGRSSGRAMGEFVGKDGLLDVARAVDQLVADKAFEGLAPRIDSEESFSPDAFSDGPGQSPLSQQQTKTCQKVLWWEECTTIQEGAFADPSKTQAHRAIQDKKYTVPDCIPGRAKVTNTWQGCAPAAVVSMLWREWANKQTFTGVPAYTPMAYDASSYPKTGFDPIVSQGLADAMGSCAILDGGTMTLPWKITSGANQWLKDHGSKLQLKGVTTTLLDNSLLSEGKATVLRNRVGRDRGPVTALIQMGTTSYHYTPVAKYRIVQPAVGPTEVYVVGFDQGQSTKSWFALHDPWTVATGLYWLEQ